MKINIRILPLAYIPHKCKNILEWRPFGQDTLGDIVNTHNNRCLQYHKNWTPEAIAQFVDLIAIAPLDLNRIRRLRVADFFTIWILLANLDDIQGKENELDLPCVKDYMTRNQHQYYLTQVSKDPSPQSLTNFFSPAPVYTVPDQPPETISSQQEFEEFLWRFSLRFDPPPHIGGGGNKGGLKTSRGKSGEGEDAIQQKMLGAFSRIKNDVRHVAIVKKLTEEQTSTLVKVAMQQELALEHIEDLARIGGTHRVVLSALRKPISGIALEPFQMPDLQEAELINFRPVRSLKDLSPQRRAIFRELGITNKACTIVNFNQPSTLDLLRRLGNSVEIINTFKANLPVFKLRD